MSARSPRRTRRRVLLAGLGLGAAMAVWGFLIEPASLRVVRHELRPAGWPSECDGLKVAVLADLHVGAPFRGRAWMSELVDQVAAAGPDLIVLAGDYVIHGVVGGTFVEPDAIAAGLSRLAAPHGVFAVLGNHDWWLDGPAVRRALEARGIRVLEDEAVATGDERCAYWVSGIGDYWEGKHDIEQALSAVTSDRPVLAVTHNPDLFPAVPARVSLTMAGHTHGGQVALPWFGPPVVPSEFGRRYATGHVVENGRDLFVSPGIGTSILPVRFLVPPEVSLLVLRSGPA